MIRHGAEVRGNVSGGISGGGQIGELIAVPEWDSQDYEEAESEFTGGRPPQAPHGSSGGSPQIQVASGPWDNSQGETPFARV